MNKWSKQIYMKKLLIISDEDDVPQASMASELTNSPIISLPILTILVADYDSEDDDEGPEEVPVKKMKMESQDDKITENTIHEESSMQVSKETSNIRSYTNAGIYYIIINQITNLKILRLNIKINKTVKQIKY